MRPMIRRAVASQEGRHIRRDSLAGCVVQSHPEIADDRGWFSYAFQESAIALATGDATFALSIRQGNHSYSHANVLRGIHREPWSKLVYVVSGRATIVVVNLIPGSDQLGDHLRLDLGDVPGGRRSVYIPVGFGNAFYCHEPTHYLNFVSHEFGEAGRHGVAWDDPSLAIDWGLAGPPILSEQDALQPALQELVRGLVSNP